MMCSPCENRCYILPFCGCCHQRARLCIMCGLCPNCCNCQPCDNCSQDPCCCQNDTQVDCCEDVCCAPQCCEPTVCCEDATGNNSCCYTSPAVCVDPCSYSIRQTCINEQGNDCGSCTQGGCGYGSIGCCGSGGGYNSGGYGGGYSMGIVGASGNINNGGLCCANSAIAPVDGLGVRPNCRTFHPDFYRRIYHDCPCPIAPGYGGHVPGYRIYGAGRTFGAALRDATLILEQATKNCPALPARIYEQ